MNTKENIALAEKIHKEYSTLDGIEKKIRDKEAILDKPVTVDPPLKVRSSVSWLSVIIGVVAVIVVLYIDIIVYAWQFALDWDSHGTRHGAGVAAIIILLSNLALVVGTVVFHIYRNQKEKNYLKERAEEEEKERMIQRREEIRKRVSELKNEYESQKEIVKQYDDLIPEPLRSRYQTKRVKILLESGKAQTLEEAIDNLMK
ncbi:MAG: hypothetical protein J6Y08_01325 [Clostridiales bacterium]|nr:hypothetical protein [Clostridiales bacterium]